jgi:type I restriction enzyme S subunit
MKLGWETRKLREVCRLVNGRAYKKPELLDDGKYRVLRVGNFFTNDHWYYSNLELEESKFCDSGDLLYAWSASFGPRMWFNGKAIFHYHIWKILHDPTLIDQKFLFYFLEWDKEKIKAEYGTGTTMIHVSMGSMNDREISFPTLEEQKNIVSLLDEAFAALATAQANAEKNLQNARALFESQLTSALANTHGKWRRVQLDALLISNRKISYGIVKPGEHDPAGVRLIKSQQVRDGTMDLSCDFRITKALDEEYARTRLEGGEVLLNLVGASIGRSAIAPEELRGANVSRAIAVIPVLPELATWVQYNLRGSVGQEHIESRTGGAAQPVLNLAEVKTLPIAMPETSERHNLVTQLDALSIEAQRLTRIYEQKQAALAALKKSLLHQAFTGDL